MIFVIYENYFNIRYAAFSSFISLYRSTGKVFRNQNSISLSKKLSDFPLGFLGFDELDLNFCYLAVRGFVVIFGTKFNIILMICF